LCIATHQFLKPRHALSQQSQTINNLTHPQWLTIAQLNPGYGSAWTYTCHVTYVAYMNTVSSLHAYHSNAKMV